MGKLMTYVSGLRAAHKPLLSCGLRCHGQGAACLGNCLNGRFGGTGHRDGRFCGELTFGQNPDTVQFATDETRCNQAVFGDRSSVELA